MIIARMTGGLGNQMFQYAAVLCLAEMHRTETRFDLTWFDAYHLHQGFELGNVFGMPIAAPGEADYRKVLGWMGHRRLRPHLWRRSLRPFRPASFVVEPQFRFWPEFHALPADVYLDGYWQSEKYFLPAVDRVRSVFRFQHSLTGPNRDLAERMAACNSVAVHVRRGDFVRDPTINAVHGLSSLAYYKAAIRSILDRVEDPYFFLFSDDMEWVRASLRIDRPCWYVDHNRGAESFNDMHLMSLCRHHIIANSSFSWWGAWLSEHPATEVIAPARWFRKEDIDTTDLVPERWMRL
jgi:hypothetical protein